MCGFPRNSMGLESSDVLSQKEAEIIFAAAASNRKANNKRNVRALRCSAPIHEPISPPNPTQSGQRGKREGNNEKVAHAPARAAAEFARLNTTEMAAVCRMVAHLSDSTSGARKMPPPTPVTPDTSPPLSVDRDDGCESDASLARRSEADMGHSVGLRAQLGSKSVGGPFA
jgi:hypothetical protein